MQNVSNRTEAPGKKRLAGLELHCTRIYIMRIKHVIRYIIHYNCTVYSNNFCLFIIPLLPYSELLVWNVAGLQMHALFVKKENINMAWEKWGISEGTLLIVGHVCKWRVNFQTSTVTARFSDEINNFKTAAANRTQWKTSKCLSLCFYCQWQQQDPGSPRPMVGCHCIAGR